MKSFKYRHQFGLQFLYRHQVYDQNSTCHSNISLEMIWDTKFWPDCNFACYLAVREANTALASGYFQDGGDIMTSLSFQRQLAIQCMENTTGTETGDIGRPMWACRIPQIVGCNQEKVPRYCGKWLPSF